MNTSFITYMKLSPWRIDTPNTQIHDGSLLWLGTGTSTKGCEVNEMYNFHLKITVYLCELFRLRQQHWLSCLGSDHNIGYPV